MSWGWLSGAPPQHTSYVPPETQAALEADTPPGDGWERSPHRDDETARRVRAMFGWGDDV